MDPVNLVEEHAGGGEYDSTFEYDSDIEKKRKKRVDLAVKEKKREAKATSEVFREEYSRDEGMKQRYHFLGLDAYTRHKKFINDYLLYYKGATSNILKRDTSKDRTDLDVIQQNHKFLWTDEDDVDTWEKRMAKKYFDKLFREYCIADLSRFKENKIALRWRIEKEVIDGKGQFSCGNKACTEDSGLRSWEVNFAYMEEGEKKNALVKLRLCSECSYKLNYRHQKKEIKAKKHSIRNEHLESHSKRRKQNTEESTSTTGNLEDKANESNKDQEEEESEEIWKGPAQNVEDKSRGEEFEEYFEDLFL